MDKQKILHRLGLSALPELSDADFAPASKEEQDKLVQTVFTEKGTLNRKCVGRDAKTLLKMIGVTAP